MLFLKRSIDQFSHDVELNLEELTGTKTFFLDFALERSFDR